MNAPQSIAETVAQTISDAPRRVRVPFFDRAPRLVGAVYRIAIEPRSGDEDERRRELIFNVIASFLFLLVCLLDLSVLYADVTGAQKGGFSFFTFSIFVAFFGSLLLLSRKGHTELASYLFIGLYFLASTWGEYVWGTAIPLALLSYGAIIVMTSILLGTRAGLAMAVIISATLVSLGFLETHGFIQSDITWRYTPLEFKDTIEDSFVYALIVAVSWLSNRELEKSLAQTKRSEKALKEERDLLEIKVEERTKELKAAEIEKASQLYRFVEFGRLASGIFHDLLNPLSVVSMSVERLEGSPTEKERAEAQMYIAKAVKASKRMEAFVQTARKQLDIREALCDFSAQGEILDAIDLLTHKSMKTGVEIRFTPAEEAAIYGNPIKFFQIAVNLISNAVDSYDGIDRSDDKGKIVDVSLSFDDEAATLKVEDGGCGIRDELKGMIFEPFFTTKRDKPRSESGFGLGLSTTKSIIEKDFGGTMSLVSSVGIGSKFTVIIPLHRDTHKKQDTRGRAPSGADRAIDRERS